jgi:hypothetical protein
MPSIMHANRLHLLLPFALPAAADASTALYNIESPALDKLIARATLVERVVGEDFQRTLPHERWVARQFGTVASGEGAADEAPLAPYMLRADGGEPGTSTWACVQPVHVRIAHDHLVLIDPASLDLTDAEAATLLDVARPLIEELGVRIEAPHPSRWYLASDAFGTLAGASPLRASGRNIEIWLPHEAHTGQRSRAWMKLQNEVQMAWFEHPVNEAREARGLPSVNSIWFHAQGAAQPVKSPFTRVLSDAAATRGLALTAGVEIGAAPASFAAVTAAPQWHRVRKVQAEPSTAATAPRQPHQQPSSNSTRSPHPTSSRTGAAGTTHSPRSKPTGSPPPSLPCSQASSANWASHYAATPAR